MDGFFPKPRQERSSRGGDKSDGVDKGSDQRDSGGDRKSHDGRYEGETEQWARDLTNREFCYFLAGIVGVNPGPLTLRKLLWMNNGKERSEWNRFSVLVAKIHNVNCTKKSEMVDFKDIHPYYIEEVLEKKRRGPSKEEVAHGMMTLKKALS